MRANKIPKISKENFTLQSTTKVVAIIPAAGRGSRAQGPIPKQYRLIHGKSVLWHTLKAFQESPLVSGIIVAINSSDRQYYEKLTGPGDFPKLYAPVIGGLERSNSVCAALQQTDEGDEIVLVHDAVRPFVTVELIDRVIAATVEFGSVIPALPVVETVKEIAGGVVVQTMERSRLWNVQTPQGFRRGALLAAYREIELSETITDEAMLVERSGRKVHVVDGDPHNVKLTSPEDFERAKWFMERHGTNENSISHIMLRIGQGYDVHRLKRDKPLILGGVTVSHPFGLDGHSDADVLTHAVIDALLGATALGDIGQHFPDDEEKYRGISSIKLLEQVRVLLDSRGISVVNVDAVVIAEVPKLAPYVNAIREVLAKTMQIDVKSVSIKATTTEGLGFVGRQEGIAAQAVVQVKM